ncbi:MAG: hypothetical protein HY914_15970 [Desulfomonile tiedjei]|nr:hypothetical protein [Desulfomonile tiedjei]
MEVDGTGMFGGGGKSAEFVDDVAAGISDEALKAKYKISGKRFFLAKAAAKDILARQKLEAPESKSGAKLSDILTDIKRNVSNQELMDKYNLTSRQLQRLFRDLINGDMATPLELSGRLSMTTSQVVEAFEAVGMALSDLDHVYISPGDPVPDE